MTYLSHPEGVSLPLPLKLDGGLDVITAVIDNQFKLYLVSRVPQRYLPVYLLSLLLPC